MLVYGNGIILHARILQIAHKVIIAMVQYLQVVAVFAPMSFTTTKKAFAEDHWLVSMHRQGFRLCACKLGELQAYA